MSSKESESDCFGINAQFYIKRNNTGIVTVCGRILHLRNKLGENISFLESKCIFIFIFEISHVN